MSKPRKSQPSAKAAVMRPEYRARVVRDKRKYHRPSMKNQEGFTLTRLLLIVVLFGLGLYGCFALFGAGLDADSAAVGKSILLPILGFSAAGYFLRDSIGNR